MTIAHAQPIAMPTRTPAPDRDWRSDALCTQVDPDLFFPKKGDAGQAKQARAVCARCPVREQCLTAALEADERFGIFGGLSVRQRDALKRDQAAGPDRATRPDRRRHRAPCGTEAGAKRHWRDGETICTPCRKAANLRHNEREEARRARQQAAAPASPRAAHA
ncbi:WhiB family transcriptional regulator [[Mycobacterium] zoologicum]|uniref:WhiB family transcriptional regulator n=1 Tax=[Mycobacterium] zoologicum TaxID=2872311 RepID=UPI002B55B494|nr:WhiB family transcriptional regulator [Mycolicibacter sp. MYC101]MEB3065048.1 WhiB family transcriptional regulator [Mycolicibacter sp. MYC101]